MNLPQQLAALGAAVLVVLVPGTGSAIPDAASASGTPGTFPDSTPGSTVDSGLPAGWSWPLTPRPAILRTFDPPARPWLSGHRGVDLQASEDGATVSSPASGTVSFAGVVVDRPVITIDHGGGLRSSFEAVRSTLEAGAAVTEGDVLGWIEPGHCLPGPCVHWGVRRGDTYVNPLAFVTDLRPSVLLPPLDPAPD